VHTTRYCVNVNSIIFIIILLSIIIRIILLYFIGNGIDNDILGSLLRFFGCYYRCRCSVAVQKTYIRTGRRDLRLLNCRRDPQQYRCFTGGPRSACAHSPGPRTRRHLCAVAGCECECEKTQICSA